MKRLSLTIHSALQVVPALWECVMQTVYPPRCVGCGRALLGERAAGVCLECHEAIDWIGDGACSVCGAAAGAFAEIGKGCTACNSHTLQFTRATAVAEYKPPVRELIHAFKFHGARRLARPMAACMAERIAEANFPGTIDSVCPVPLHPRRRRERGYNQSELLAKGIAGLLQWPMRTRILERVRYTSPQALLRQKERRTNPLGAFRATTSLPGASVLLVDDVLTTGTTVSECAVALRKAGANRVYVAVFAR